MDENGTNPTSRTVAGRPIISRRASFAGQTVVAMGVGSVIPIARRWRLGGFLALVLAISGCAQRDRNPALGLDRPSVLVVAPVLNLSGSRAFDPLRITDLIASEFLSYENVAVVPVNLTLAELDRQGLAMVESPEDAVAVARALGADATIVTAITEYDPYYPPRVGLVMQWYPADRQQASSQSGFDPVTASRWARGGEPALSESEVTQPRWQVQRVFNAANESLCDDIRRFAAEREGHNSPQGWRKYVHSQELYVRYCGWATIRTMLTLDQADRDQGMPNEAK